MPLPLVLGARGEDVRDLHRRLAACGFAVVGPRTDYYSDATADAVSRLQHARGLAVTGVVDGPTWHQLVEAGYRLGDRLLYLHAPMLRGDDVAELQLRLGSLGFDAGRVDGIFGPDTERALVDFQRNSGLPTDAIAGQATVRELARLGARADQRDPVAVVRERERLRRAPRSLVDRHIVIGEYGGAAAVVHATARHLRLLGAAVITLHHPDPSHQAAETNAANADLYLALELSPAPVVRATFFATTGFESAGGRRLAALVAHGASEALQALTELQGNRTPVLRETRMPAVQLLLGPVASVNVSLARLSSELATAIAQWFLDPIDDAESLPQPSARS